MQDLPRTHRRLGLAFATALLLPQGAHTETTDANVRPIDTITIVGRQADVADVPGSAHVIDSEALGVFLDADILRVLRTVPGVYLQEEEGFGLRPNIGIRGSGLDRSARIALLEDGILIAPAPYSAPAAYYFPTQRRMTGLEVLKGPASVAIGPRTTGGAINMLSTPIPDDFSALVDVRGGDERARDIRANIGNRGERIGWLLETVQSESDGFKTIDAPNAGPSGFELDDFVARFEVSSDAGSTLQQSLGLKLGYTEQHADETYLGLTDVDFDADPHRRYAASAGDVFDSEHELRQLTYSIDPGGTWRADLSAYRNDFERNWYKLQSVNGTGISAVLNDETAFATELGHLRGNDSPDDAIVKRANKRSYYSQGVQGQVVWDTGIGDANVALTAGFRLHEDEEDRFQHEDAYRMQDRQLELTSSGAPGSTTNRVSDASVQAFFLSAEIRSGRWIVTPGLRHESIDLRRLDFSTADPSRAAGPTRVRRNSISSWIPGLGALYRLNDNWRLLAGIHKGFNPPAPGSSVDEESSLNIELGARFDNGSLRFESIYFVNDYDNLVGTVTASTGGGGDIGDQFDGGEARVSGLELTAAYGASVGKLAVPMSLSYTWTQEAEFENAFDSSFDPWGDVAVGDELPYIPAHQLRAATGLEGERWRLNVSAAWVDRMRSVAGQGAFAATETVESHIVWDAMASWSFSQRFSTYLKLDNAFDATYVASRRPAGVRPGLPRTLYLGLTFRL